MYITAHAAAGAVLGQYISSVPLAFLAGFVMHLILDMIPHGDKWIKDWKWFKSRMTRIAVASFIDLIGVITMSIYWINHSDSKNLAPMLAAIAGSVAPDALWGLYELTKSPILKWYRTLHTEIHELIFKKEISMKQGFLLQIIFVIIATWIIG